MSPWKAGGSTPTMLKRAGAVFWRQTADRQRLVDDIRRSPEHPLPQAMGDHRDHGPRFRARVVVIRCEQAAVGGFDPERLEEVS